ncbi:MAG TPA: hypothetical protein VIY86_00200 [Pirellulaceae bacterium]
MSIATRNLVLGLVILAVGLQVRVVESFVLTQKASRFIQEKLSSDRYLASGDPYGRSWNSNPSMMLSAGPVIQKRFSPPRWLGWAMISIGAVLVLHGLTNRRL